MKKWLAVLVIVVAAAGYFINQQRELYREQAYRLGVSELKRSFAARAVGLRLIDADAYRLEIGAALTDYFAALDGLAKQHPGAFDLERERARAAADLAAGRLKEAQKLAMDERIDLTVDLFKRMRTGQYRPLYTTADRTFRFDIYELGRAKVNGQERIKLAFVHWGAFGPVTYTMIEGDISAKQEKGKPVELHKIVAEGAAPNLQLEAERWVAEFPPGAVLGYYDLPLLPPQATGLELTFTFAIQSPGGTSIPVTIAFPEMAVRDDWRLGEGQKWEGEEQVASDEELQRAAGVTIK